MGLTTPFFKDLANAALGYLTSTDAWILGSEVIKYSGLFPWIFSLSASLRVTSPTSLNLAESTKYL